MRRSWTVAGVVVFVMFNGVRAKTADTCQAWEARRRPSTAPTSLIPYLTSTLGFCAVLLFACTRVVAPVRPPWRPLSKENRALFLSDFPEVASTVEPSLSSLTEVSLLRVLRFTDALLRRI